MSDRAFAHLCGLMVGLALLVLAAWDLAHEPAVRYRVQVIDVCEANPADSRCDGERWRAMPELVRRR